MTMTVIDYLMERLHGLGIEHVFGVPGDYAFPVNDAVVARKDMQWVGCSNELNAAYSADGYARIKGVAALSTTFGVGELSAMNGVAGAYAEHLPVIHIVGMPTRKTMASHSLVHHTFGDGNFHAFYQAAEAVSCARTILEGENCVSEVDRVLGDLLTYRRPIYIGIPSDAALEPVSSRASTSPYKEPVSDAAHLAQVVDRIAQAVQNSQQPCVLPGILAQRLGCQQDLERFLETSQLPYATMFMDKSVANEHAPGYVGMYCGHLVQREVAHYVENADLVLNIGAEFNDFNTGAFTAELPQEKMITLKEDHVLLGNEKVPHVVLRDVLAALVEKQVVRPQTVSLPGYRGDALPAVQGDESRLHQGTLYASLEKIFQDGDIIVAETGTISMGTGFIRLPKGVSYQSQTLWGAIGWATPAAFGMALAAPHQRVILLTGEGSHQLTVQALGEFGRFGCKPLVMVLNNDGYLIERLLCKDGSSYYNDVPAWDYTLLPKAFGCRDWQVARVTTRHELNNILTNVQSPDHKGAYIEVVTPDDDTPPMAASLGKATGTLYH